METSTASQSAASVLAALPVTLPLASAPPSSSTKSETQACLPANTPSPFVDLTKDEPSPTTKRPRAPPPVLKAVDLIATRTTSTTAETFLVDMSKVAEFEARYGQPYFPSSCNLVFQPYGPIIDYYRTGDGGDDIAIPGAASAGTYKCSTHFGLCPIRPKSDTACLAPTIYRKGTAGAAARARREALSIVPDGSRGLASRKRKVAEEQEEQGPALAATQPIESDDEAASQE